MSTRWLVRRPRTQSRAPGLCDRSRSAAFAAAEAKLDQSLVLGRRTTRSAIWYWGYVKILDQARCGRASPNANMRWRWIEISPTPMPLSDSVRFSSVAPKRPRLMSARPCASARAIRWPTLWMAIAGTAKLQLGDYEQAVAWFRRSIEANRNFPLRIFLVGFRARRSSVGSTKRVPRSRLASLSTRPSPFPALAPSGQG